VVSSVLSTSLVEVLTAEVLFTSLSSSVAVEVEVELVPLVVEIVLV